ncbi:MAG TPA: hypothetical protein VD860_16835 [Azospirillum sp.]|nr:hypothetical protein [Azospirillum sp.]
MTTNLKTAISLRGDRARELLDRMAAEHREARAKHLPSAGIAERNAMVVRAALEKHVARKQSLLVRVARALTGWGRA